MPPKSSRLYSPETRDGRRSWTSSRRFSVQNIDTRLDSSGGTRVHISWAHDAHDIHQIRQLAKLAVLWEPAHGTLPYSFILGRRHTFGPVKPLLPDPTTHVRDVRTSARCRSFSIRETPARGPRATNSPPGTSCRRETAPPARWNSSAAQVSQTPRRPNMGRFHDGVCTPLLAIYQVIALTRPDLPAANLALPSISTAAGVTVRGRILWHGMFMTMVSEVYGKWPNVRFTLWDRGWSHSLA